MGQNSTQNPQPLQRSTVMATKPLAMNALQVTVGENPCTLGATIRTIGVLIRLGSGWQIAGPEFFVVYMLLTGRTLISALPAA